MASTTTLCQRQHGYNNSPVSQRKVPFLTRYLMKRPWFFIILGALLLLIDDYLILRGLGGAGIAFLPAENDPVIGSAYGKVMGVPLGLLGLLTHLALFWAVLKQMKSLAVILACLIVAAAVCLVAVQVVILSEWCAWCNSAHVLGMVLALGCSKNWVRRPHLWNRRRYLQGLGILCLGLIFSSPRVLNFQSADRPNRVALPSPQSQESKTNLPA